jgi:hypothetical protein
MRLIGRLRQGNHGIGSIIGAVFVALIFLSGFAFYAVTQDVTQHYNDTISSMNDKDWNRNQEKIVIKQIAITSTNKLNVTAENDGPVQSHLIWLGIFNKTATPENQTYQASNEFVRPGETDNIVSNFTVTVGNMYVIQLVTELGNTVESKFYPAKYASCALTLVTTPPTVYQGNNITVLLTVTPNDTVVDSIQTLTATLNATPTNLVQLMGNSSLSVSGLTDGTSAFFWWTYNAASIGTVSFNATYLQAPAGTYVLSTAQIVSPPQQGSVTITGVNCTASQNPSTWNLLGSTQNVGGSTTSLASNDTNYANFSSYYSGTNINHFVDNNSSNVDNSTNLGTQSNFTALQQGGGPGSIYYDNLTEALSPQYGEAFISSSVRASTVGTTLVDDLQAVLNVTLNSNSTALMIYNAGNKYNSIEDANGMRCAISVDGTDVAFSWQAPMYTNCADSVTVVYAANLTAGSHIIKGRFSANNASATVGIDLRQLGVFWFQNVTASFVRSNVSATTTQSAPVNDPQASLTFTLSYDSVSLILYNAGNKPGSSEPTTGKGVTINIDGSDIATKQWQSPGNPNIANSATIAYVGPLTAGSHTVTGRFFSGTNGSTTTIDERQLIVFSFPTSFATYGFVQSTTSVNTTSGTPVTDTYALLSPSLTTNSNCLMMYVAGNSPSPTNENYNGKGIQLKIDTGSISNSTSWQSPNTNNYTDSVTSLWCTQLAAGSHTIQGTFFENANDSYTVTVSSRQLVFIAFPIPTYQLNLETQFTNVQYTQQNARLCIYGGSMSSNPLGVEYWNATTSSWNSVSTSLNASSWNNITVTLTSSVFTIRFEAGIYSKDLTQGSWNVSAVLLYLWTNQYTAQVEFTDQANLQNWTQLVWLADSSWTISPVNVTIQLYNYMLGNYSSSGDGYVFYVSNLTNADQCVNQTITSSPTNFRNNSTGYWKVEITGVAATQFQMNINWIELQDSYAYVNDSIPYKAWVRYTIQATAASGNPLPYTYVSLYANGTTVAFQNATSGASVSDPAWIQLDANGTFQLQIESITSSGETFVLYATVGNIVQQKTITQVPQQ